MKHILIGEEARAVLEAARAEARRCGWAVTIAIVDDGGHLLMAERMDGASPGSIYLAIEKARTAALGRHETKAYQDIINSGGTAMLSAQLFLMIEGGVPLSKHGTVVGAIGVSGVDAVQDATVAKAGVSALLIYLQRST